MQYPNHRHDIGLPVVQEESSETLLDHERIDRLNSEHALGYFTDQTPRTEGGGALSSESESENIEIKNKETINESVDGKTTIDLYNTNPLFLLTSKLSYPSTDSIKAPEYSPTSARGQDQLGSSAMNPRVTGQLTSGAPRSLEEFHERLDTRTNSGTETVEDKDRNV
jgi:hypothetical protein